MDFLQITDENKSYYVYIRDFNRHMFNKRKNKNKKFFHRYCFQCRSSERVLQEHKFKSYFKQLAVSFKSYSDFESILKRIHSDDTNNASYTKMYKADLPCSFAYKVVCIDDRFSKSVVYNRRREKNAVNKFTETILKENEYCKKIIKKHFNKNLLMFVEDERNFKSSNKCCIFNKLFASGDNKVRIHDHVTGKYRSSVYWNCNINLKLAKKVPVIFHNFKDYDSHLIMQEFGKSDLKISYKPIGIKRGHGFYN